MAQQRQLLGHVKGDKGDKGEPGTNGKDAVISGATGRTDASHLDQPTVTVQVGGEPGAQTFDFDFKGFMGPKGEAGPKGDAGTPGAAGKDGVSVTHEWEGTTLKVTSASGTTSADLVGPAGPTGPAGAQGPAYKPGGTTGQIVLGDGSTVDIATFFTVNVEAMRTAIGPATKEHMGLVPNLPS